MDDLISRQAVIDAIKRCESADRYDFNNGMIRLFRALNAIADIPSAQPKRKTGKWAEHHIPYTWMGYTYWSCTNCGYECGYEKEIRIRTNYCPNCGCAMKGENDETD